MKASCVYGCALFPDDTADNQYKCWLRKTYDEAFTKIINCLESNKHSIQIQALSTAMKILSFEGKYPLEPIGDEYYFPVQKLKVSYTISL